jgi:two-component system KDP operon response regulator KdpE
MMQARGRADSPPARPGPTTGRRILIVEDEPALLRALLITLRARGYDVATAATGNEALSEAARQRPDAVLLDLGLPDADGAEVIRELRAWSRAAVIVISGRAGSHDKIGALDAGADDYVTKPFDTEELLARLRAALRRDDRTPGLVTFRIGRCEIDLAAHTIARKPRSGSEQAGRAAGTSPAAVDAVHLTPTEWRLLEILLNAPGQLVGSDRLLTEVWGAGFERSTHYLRFHMARLRRKLEEDPPRPRHLITEPGIGYRYQP